MAFLIGFVSHFFVDALPHLDPGTFFWPGDKAMKESEPWPAWIYIFAVSEFIIIWLIMILLFKNRDNFGIILMGGLGGIAVDVLDNNPLRFFRTWPILKQLHYLHEKIHYDLPHNKWYWGIPLQIIIIGGGLWYLLK